MKRLLMTVAAALGLGSIGSVATATEEPRYTVIRRYEGVGGELAVMLRLACETDRGIFALARSRHPVMT